MADYTKNIAAQIIWSCSLVLSTFPYKSLNLKSTKIFTSLLIFVINCFTFPKFSKIWHAAWTDQLQHTYCSNREKQGDAITTVAAIFNDVHAQNVPTQFCLNFPCRKVMIYFWQKGKTIRGHRLHFGENTPWKTQYPGKSEKSGFIS